MDGGDSTFSLCLFDSSFRSPLTTTPLLHRIEPARRADGSLRDTFSDVPTPALLDRMSTEAIEHNKRTKMKYGLGYWE
jgi:hypothetical protein